MTSKKYYIQIKKSAFKFLEKQQKHIKERFKIWLEKLALNPLTENDGIFINNNYNGKIIYKKRIGKIRVFYVIYEKEVTILIIDIDNRGQAYK